MKKNDGVTIKGGLHAKITFKLKRSLLHYRPLHFMHILFQHILEIDWFDLSNNNLLSLGLWPSLIPPPQFGCRKKGEENIGKSKKTALIEINSGWRTCG